MRPRQTDTLISGRLPFLNLVTSEGRGFLVDSDHFAPAAVSPVAYEVMRALKAGVRRHALHARFGRDLVEAAVAEAAAVAAAANRRAPGWPRYAEARTRIEALRQARPRPVQAMLMLAQTCNLSCLYCYGRAGTFGSAGLMPTSTARAAFEYFLSIAPPDGALKITFFGGEPLLNLPALHEVLECRERLRADRRDRDLRFSITTNATRVSRHIARLFKEHDIAVTLSIDGPPAIQDRNRPTATGGGSSQLVTAGIDALRAEGVDFAVRATLTREDSLREVVSGFESECLRRVSVATADAPHLRARFGWDFGAAAFRRLVAEQRQILKLGCERICASGAPSVATRLTVQALDTIRWVDDAFPFPCQGGWRLITVAIDGRIYPCHRLVGQAGYAIGTIWKGLDAERIATLYGRFLASSTKCDECWARPRCGRRCMGERAVGHGRFGGIAAAVCEGHRHLFAGVLTIAADLQMHAQRTGVTVDALLGPYRAETGETSC